MILTPLDIAAYMYCPYLLEAKDKALEVIAPPLSPYENCVRETIIRVEELCLLRGSEITARKMIRVWDSIWWPVVTSLGLDMKEAKEESIKASSILADYCRYDLSDISYPTVCTKPVSKRPLGSSVLHVQSDIMKVDVSARTKNMVLLDFSRRNLTDLDMAIDPMIRTTAWAFYTGHNETVTYISVDVTGGSSKLKVKISFFRPDELEEIGKAVKLAEQGIRQNIKYVNPWKCRECDICNSKSLMRNGIRSR
jgi:hypothetical protein